MACALILNDNQHRPDRRLCAGAKTQVAFRSGFRSASVRGWQSPRLPTDYVGMAEASAVSAALDPLRGM
jgi:hypothetical protein